MADLTRRAFLKIAAGTGAAAAVGVASKNFDKLIPYITPPPIEQIVPGVWSVFATVCRECPAGCGMHVRHRDGRAVKCEGNPAHPVSRGTLCPRGQAALQGLYNPSRLCQPMSRARPGEALAAAAWPEAMDRAAAALAQARQQGGRVRILSDLQTGALAEVMGAFTAALGGSAPIFHEAFTYESVRRANEMLFGRPQVPDYRLDGCRVIVSLATDFLETWVSPVQFAQDYAMNLRNYRDDRDGTLAYFGPRLSMTAANADDFALVAPGEEYRVALALLNVLLERGLAKGDNGRLRTLAAAVGPADLPAGVKREMIEHLAMDFAQRPSVCLAGGHGGGVGALKAALAAGLLNAAAGRIGQTVDFARPHALSSVATAGQMEQMLASLTAKDVVIVHNTNPAFTQPATAGRLRAAGTIVYLGLFLDETAEVADLVLPTDSPLESWGDYEPLAGVHGLMQPTLGRVFDTHAAGDILLELANRLDKPLARAGETSPPDSYEAWLKARWNRLRAAAAPAKAFDDFWHDSLQAGGVTMDAPAANVALAASTLTAPPAAPQAGGAAQLWAWPSIMLFDGRGANRGWLQEAPDPISYITWGPWIEMHPDRAKALGVHDNEVVELRNARGRAAASVRITADIAEGVVGLPIGLGHTAEGYRLVHTQMGAVAPRGDNTWALLDAEGFAGPVEIVPTGRKEEPLYTSPTQEQHGREIVQWVDHEKLSHMKPGEGDKIVMPLPEGYQPETDLYPPHEYRGHRWAMVIDMARCIGCGACSVACYAENNIAVMGPEQVGKGREMAWLKVVPYRDEEDARRLGWLPMLCQQCDAAPCEPVCPVFAAVHNDEGLNSQIYNRCIGTRYCSNNCPYKVRRFNWLNLKWPKPLDWQLNPEVTVRVRGVMEKCTFCIQRIREKQYAARREGRPVRDGEIQPACAQTCPARVFVFGDLLDKESEVNRLMRQDPRRYHVLAELNTKPAVTYLRRVKKEA